MKLKIPLLILIALLATSALGTVFAEIDENSSQPQAEIQGGEVAAS